ncbi:polysaccharide biosynthesis protein [Mesobaculum littorinae]|uniref:Polysaccharide biosynthesis protein n=1 Tax=Mesobaculum littorinae TaxID=2486419 RepID=A0A438AD54_9RHOB|nr:polysaccharide biosynthesis/export family protein [Mesobaculum littorinae]RVV96562.1 polysaccharide biosynthesis protein [Mesobaculum littorinae]
MRENIEPAIANRSVTVGRAYQAQYRTPPEDYARVLRAPAINAEPCLPPRGPAAGTGRVVSDGKGVRMLPPSLQGEILSRGDLVDLRVAEDETFTGSYVISRDGTLKLPYLDPIPAQGRAPAEVVTDIRDGLVASDFYVETPPVSLLLTDFAAVRVAVSGAVFEPGAKDIGAVAGAEADALRRVAFGASTEGRNLSVALRSAGGIRPDADLSAVEIRRAGAVWRVDLRDGFAGGAFDDVMLVAGDEIVVPSRQCFQDELMVPGPFSPPGITLFMSSLTVPATSNSQAAIGRDVREVQWGTRFMQAVVDNNCVGGIRATSANRAAALLSRNPATGVSVVIERDIEEMLDRPDRDDYDPYLLPGDAIACYDSTVTNVADLGRVLGTVAAVAAID